MSKHNQYTDIYGFPTWQKAMSLIEIMLVIAVLATLSSIGIKLLQQDVDAQKIAKTVEQFQTLTLVTRNYFEYQGVWPDDAALKSFVPHIYGTGKMTNPWGNDFTLALNPPLPVPPAPLTPPSISTIVPNVLAAQLIIARLPFSNYPTGCVSNCVVTTYLTVPSIRSWLLPPANLPKVYSFGTLSAASNADTGKADAVTIPVPTADQCGQGYTPKWIAGIQSFVRDPGASDQSYEGSSARKDWIGSVFLCRKSNNPAAVSNPNQQTNTCRFSDKIPDGDNQVIFATHHGGADLNSLGASVHNLKSSATLVYFTYCDPGA